MGMLYVLEYWILEGIGHENIIRFCYYDDNCSSGSRGNMIGISTNGNVIGILV